MAAAPLNHVPTCVFGGYFYNSSSPVPPAAEVDAWLEFGRVRGVSQFMVPTVRNPADAGALAARGFVKLPWFVESIYERREGVDADLRAQVGRKRQKQLVRLTRKADEFYEASYYHRPAALADPTVLETAAALHACNAAKYGHPLNLYSLPLLQQLLASPLGDRLWIGIRRDRETGEPVQASLSLVDRERSQLYMLVHGIRHSAVRPGQNLDIADTYTLLRLAEALDLREVNFGRGMPAYKQRLGANRFLLLNNWLLPGTPETQAAAFLLAERAQESLGIAAVTAAVKGVPVR
jgi:hypothetical protein